MRAEAVADPAPDSVLLDLELSTGQDIPAADMLKGLHAELKEEATMLAPCRAHTEARVMLERCGAIEAIGAGNICGGTTARAINSDRIHPRLQAKTPQIQPAVQFHV